MIMIYIVDRSIKIGAKNECANFDTIDILKDLENARAALHLKSIDNSMNVDMVVGDPTNVADDFESENKFLEWVREGEPEEEDLF